MIEVAPRLFVGNALDYETRVKGREGWRVVQCAKEPYHRQAVGYTSRGAPRDHPEYLFAHRDGRLVLNMVDVDDHHYFAPEMIDTALDYMEHMLGLGSVNLLCHCNQGGSRAPGLALLYLHQRTGPDVSPFGALSYPDAEAAFRSLYPNFTPARGIRDYLVAHWDDRGPQG